VLTNGSSAGGDFLLNGLPWWTNVFGEARHANLIKPVVNIARRYQIPHCRFQGFVPHPVLNRSHIEAGPEHTSGIRRPKCLQIELLVVQSRALRDCFALEQHVVFSIAGWRGKHEPFVMQVRACFEQLG
jgi:hypothetical protein